MGEVYKARDTRLDRIVAIKVSQAEFGERFEREARVVAGLNHPNKWRFLPIALRSMVGGGGVAWWPDWSPSGTHFLFSGHRRVGGPAIEDKEIAGSGFSRRLIQGGIPMQPRWSPDGARIVFTEGGPRLSLKMSNASGGHAIVLDANPGRLPGSSWSPDGQWIAYLRNNGPKQEVVRIRASPGATPVFLADARGRGGYHVTSW